jgi:SAM-dependent methyltransferase
MISVTTPLPQSHTPYIREAYDSLCNQTHKDWRWYVLENAGGKLPEDISKDSRVKVMQFQNDQPKNNIGALKRVLNDSAESEYIVELDADDFLLPNALQRVNETFHSNGAKFVYSNNADFNEKWESRYFSEYWGWKKREFNYNGHKLWEMRDFQPSAQAFRLIYWQPDHLKAWRKDAYLDVGGHDPKMAICDDQDLCSRFYMKYGAKGFKLIDECLYMYRMHKDNSCVVFNPEVQNNAQALYRKQIHSMAEKWADDEGLSKLDFGGGIYPKEGYKTVDIRDSADIVCDMNLDWPIEDNSVGVLRAFHIVEHLRDPIHTMNEAYRVLAPGGFMFIDVPSTDGRGAFQDPTHCSWWNENSFGYYTDKSQAVYIQPQYKGRFQVSTLYTYDMKEKVPVVRADLIAVKPGYEEIAAGNIKI